MTDTASIARAARPPFITIFISTPAIAFALAMGLGVVVTEVTLPIPADTVLGPFFGGLLLALLIAPALIVADERWRVGVLSAAAVFAGIAGAWLMVVIRTSATPGQLVQCGAILFAWLVAIVGVVSLLRAFGVTPSVAAAVTILIGLAWLSWPIWMSPYLPGQSSVVLADRLISPHPLFAANAVLQREGGWTSAPIAYHLISLGQDVPYSMPTGIGWCVILHLLIGGGAFGIARAVAGRRRGGERKFAPVD